MRNLACLYIGDAAKNQGQWSMLSMWGCHTGNGENGRMEREYEETKNNKEVGNWGRHEREISIDGRLDTNNAFTLMPIM